MRDRVGSIESRKVVMKYLWEFTFVCEDTLITDRSKTRLMSSSQPQKECLWGAVGCGSLEKRPGSH